MTGADIQWLFASGYGEGPIAIYNRRATEMSIAYEAENGDVYIQAETRTAPLSQTSPPFQTTTKPSTWLGYLPAVVWNSPEKRSQAAPSAKRHKR